MRLDRRVWAGVAGLVGLAGAAGLAWAAPGGVAESGTAPSFLEERCGRAALGPEAWTYAQAERGWRGNGDKDREEAVAEARSEAESALWAKACAGFSAADCGAIKKYGYTVPAYDEKRKLACAVAGVRPEHIQRSPSLKEAETALAGFVTQIQPKIPAEGAALVVGRVQDGAGCALPALDPIRLLVQGQLKVVQHEVGAEQPGDRRLLLEGAMSGDRVVLSAALSVKPGERMPLGSVSLPASAWGITAIQPECRGDGPMGLAAGRLPGAPFGLTLQHGGVDDQFCPGERFTLSAASERPARLHLYSVLPDGRAYHVWPSAGQDNLVSGAREIETLVAGPTPGGDEYLLAVAVPAESAPTALDRHAGFCRSGRNPGPGWYPQGAAAAAVTWRIDKKNCAAPSAAEMQQIDALLQRAPLCP